MATDSSPIDSPSPTHSGLQRRHRPKPKRVLQARVKALAKAQSQNGHDIVESSSFSKPDLMSRLFMLPGEVRNNIYRQLLVRPCKFDMNHAPDCKGTFWYARPGPAWSVDRETDLCGRCKDSGWKRHVQLPIFRSPARSQWGTQENEYLCDNCYWDVQGRYEGKPCMRSLHCLCSRRRNLHMLLICRRFWIEAAPIFWSENFFAFELPSLLTGFLSCIRPEVRSWIRHISFLPLHDGIFYKESESFWGPGSWNEEEFESADWPGWKCIKQCWNLLRECHGLVDLELDVVCLKRLDEILLLRRIHAARNVSFFRHPRGEEVQLDYQINELPYIWRSHSWRIPVETPTTRLLASSMIGGRLMRKKIFKQHYFETTLQDRLGGDVYPEEE